MTNSPHRYYCTYFDQRFLTPAMVLMESMLRWERNATFFCLCQDQASYDFLKQLNSEIIIPVAVATLEEHDKQLAEARNNRSLIEFYFTCTPCFPSYLFDKYPHIDIMTYLDADLYFYAPPQGIFDEIGDRSVAIVPHRFSPIYEGCRPYGTYNVGWISWRNDPVGRQCLADYRSQCLEWCYDRLEPTRFADQKYLNSWPDRYPNLCVVENIGANVAVWNVDNFTLSKRGEYPYVNDQRILFYHFHGVRIGDDGKWTVRTHPTVYSNPFLVGEMYRPYLGELTRMQQMLRERGLAPINNQEIRYPAGADGEKGEPPPATAAAAAPPQPQPQSQPQPQPQPQPAPGGFRFVGPTWPAEPAPVDQGWNAPHIAAIRNQQFQDAQVRLETPALFGFNIHDQINNTLLALAVAALNPPGGTTVSVLDWGGGVGGVGALLRRALPNLRFDYAVKELPHICAMGRQIFPQAAFFEDDASALSRDWDLILLNSVLQYVRDWPETLAQLARRTRLGLLIGRHPVVNGAASHIVEQEAYGTRYASWVMQENELFAAAARAGLRLIWKTQSGDAFAVAGAPEQPRCFTYLFRPAVPA